MPDTQKDRVKGADARATIHQVKAPVQAAPSGRDSRIDVLRGVALLTIFINHVPGTVFENFTTRNFGFSDAAEAFVMISGISAALAYSGGFAHAPLWSAAAKIWRRAWTLYLVHLMLCFWAIAIVFATWRFGGSMKLVLRDNFQFLLSDPYGVLIGLPTLGHQFGYVNILPLYTMLLLATPAIVLSARRWPGLTLAGSVALWCLAGLERFNIPAYPLKGGWFFNPFSWQLLFVFGILIGLSLKQGRGFVPLRRSLIIAAWGFLVFSLVWLKWAALGSAINEALGWASVHGVPWLFVAFDKTYVSLPRLLHIVALAYALSALPWLRAFCDRPVMAPLAVLGRQALPVFALGTILSFAARAVKEIAVVPSATLDTVLIVAGTVMMVALAAALDQKRATRIASAPYGHRAVPAGA
jgi:hypothetical protein